MDTAHIAIGVAAIIAAQAALWALLFWRFGRQASRLKDAIDRSGEIVVIQPSMALYQRSLGGIVSLKTQGVMALTDRRLVFRKPIGGDIEIPISQVAGVSENTWFRGNYRGGRRFLILKLAGRADVGFMVKDHDRWMREIAARISRA